MQIEAYNNLISSMAGELKNAVPTDKNAPSKDSGRVAEVGKGFDGIIEKALIEPDDRQAVAQARQALIDGTLFNQQALENAAENLLNDGI